MAVLSFNYLNISTLSKENIKTKLQSQINLITATVFQCKEYSNSFPIQNGGLLANDSLLNSLECNTSTPYALDGGKNSFIPIPIAGFTSYTATQKGNEFYFSTSAELNSNNDEALKELNSTYSANQYELIYVETNATLNFYISR